MRKSKKNWYTKFSFKDYESDLNLRMCSLAAQGLWMRMLCIMNAGRPFGHLSMYGQTLSTSDLASVVGKPAEEIETLLQELENKEVFSRDKSGCIFNRRMIREREISGVRAEAAKSRGRGAKPKTDLTTEDLDGKFAEGFAQQTDPTYSNSKSNSKKEEPKTASLGAGAPKSGYPDLRSEVWGEGKRIVSGLGKMSAKDAGAFVGLVVKDLRQDLRKALEIFRRAEREEPVDVCAWIRGAVRAENAEPKLSAKQAAAARVLGGLDAAQKTHNNVFPVVDGSAEEVRELA